MTVLVYLIPVALLIGLASLAAFLWALKSGQYDDMDGAAERILIDSEPDGKIGGKVGGKIGNNAGSR